MDVRYIGIKDKCGNMLGFIQFVIPRDVPRACKEHECSSQWRHTLTGPDW